MICSLGLHTRRKLVCFRGSFLHQKGLSEGFFLKATFLTSIGFAHPRLILDCLCLQFGEKNKTLGRCRVQSKFAFRLDACCFYRSIVNPWPSLFIVRREEQKLRRSQVSCQKCRRCVVSSYNVRFCSLLFHHLLPCRPLHVSHRACQACHYLGLGLISCYCFFRLPVQGSAMDFCFTQSPHPKKMQSKKCDNILFFLTSSAGLCYGLSLYAVATPAS